jgi:hypothetical protein
MIPTEFPEPARVREITFDSLVREIAFETFGIRFGIGVDDPGLWPRIAPLIPPHSRPCDAKAIDQHFTLISNESGTFTLLYDIRDGQRLGLNQVLTYVASDVDLPMALGMLDDYLRSVIGMRAADRIFIHGGAVAYRDRMIVLPGVALNGKSTLVAALVRAGATYYSDKFIVLDEEGRVHPYASSIPLGDAGVGGNHGRSPGGQIGREPLPVGAIVLTGYLPGAAWDPKPLSPGEGVLALASLAVPVHDRQEEVMGVIRRVFDAAPLVVQSDRDEAEPVAASLLAELDRRPAASN